jgi:hypothetical protein
MDTFQVVVGNLGTVYSGDNREEAVERYFAYCDQADLPWGRASGEPVTLLSYGDVEWEKAGKSDEVVEYDEMPYSDIDLNEVCNHLAQITKEFWEAHRRSRPKAETDRLEAEVTRLSKIIRGV